MKFGTHVPTVERDKTQQSPSAVFTRGLKPPGTQWKFEFENGYGASVINDGYGSEQGLYELAVLFEGHISYATPLTDDVLGCLSEEEVAEKLDAIKALRPLDIHAEAVRRAQAEVEAAQERLDKILAEVSA